MFDVLTSARREVVGSATVARAGCPALPISVRAFMYPCRARVRVPCFMLLRCGNNAYLI
jgi:hypothetical protein